MEIKISIVDKRPTVEGSPVIVCGNSDYSIQFTFDAEWDWTTTKTARFVFVSKGVVKYEDVVFEGNTAEVPVLDNIKEVLVGVYAENLRTTVPARIPCELSIRCGTSAPADFTPSQYDQIMALIQAGELKGATYTPVVDPETLMLSWDNDQGLPNPEPVKVQPMTAQQVGAEDLGELPVIPVGADLNDYVTPGAWMLPTDGDELTLNKPVDHGSASGRLVVKYVDPYHDDILQICSFLDRAYSRIITLDDSGNAMFVDPWSQCVMPGIDEVLHDLNASINTLDDLVLRYTACGEQVASEQKINEVLTHALEDVNARDVSGSVGVDVKGDPWYKTGNLGDIHIVMDPSFKIPGFEYCMDVVGQVYTDGYEGENGPFGHAILQFYNPNGSVYKATKRCYNGTWGPFRWENPPMLEGAEYCTTENFDGLAVFCTLVNVGSLPNNSNIHPVIDIPTDAIVCRVQGIATKVEENTSKTFMPIPQMYDEKKISVSVNTAGILSVKTNFDASAYSGKITIWYTKNTVG